MRRIAVRGIAFLEGTLLCVKLKNYGDAIAGDYWCLPGGSVEEGEDLLQGLHREMVEETAVAPLAGNILYINHFLLNSKEHLEFFIHIKNPQDFQSLDLGKASHAEEEIEQIAFIKPAQNFILPEFLSQVDIGTDIENGSPTQYFNRL